jgi:peptide/nickel transport system substrate-binding protein/oligopeptide transport system substrate-binding protein
VKLAEEVTVDINGTATTYPAGTQYGKIVQDQLDADGIKITVWDPTAEAGAGSSDGFDGWYNAANAAEYMKKAVEELGALGMEISKENPIYLDLPCWATNESYANRAQAYKQSVETVLGGKVKVNLNACVTSQEWYYAGYYTDYGYQANYDMYDVSGWGPDYGDPQTYLDTFLPDGAGYMVKCIGVF